MKSAQSTINIDVELVSYRCSLVCRPVYSESMHTLWLEENGILGQKRGCWSKRFIWLIDWLIDWVKVFRPTRHKIDHFRYVFPSQSLTHGIRSNCLLLTVVHFQLSSLERSVRGRRLILDITDFPPLKTYFFFNFHTLTWFFDRLTGIVVVVLAVMFVIDRVKWRHISMVEIRSPFCRSRPSYCMCVVKWRRFIALFE